ncbi:MAG: hypothetical protein H6658_14380 [Ardenticatenaceae bacterium]|nr:hypothetical protein [Ardenticatenaceae bacterium]
MKNNTNKPKKTWPVRTVRGGMFGAIVGLFVISSLYPLIQDNINTETYSSFIMISFIVGSIVGMLMGAFQEHI